MKISQSFNKLKKREKVLLILTLTICCILLISKLVVDPITKSLNNVTENYESKRLLLSKYNHFVSNEEWYKKKLNILEKEFNILQGKVLHFETEELASAKLQELAKKIAKRNGLAVSKSIAGKKRIIKTDPLLLFISANFEINNIKHMKRVKKFLYDLEFNKEKFFFVQDIKVKGIGIDDSRAISISAALALIASINKE